MWGSPRPRVTILDLMQFKGEDWFTSLFDGFKDTDIPQQAVVDSIIDRCAYCDILQTHTATFATLRLILQSPYSLMPNFGLIRQLHKRHVKTHTDAFVLFQTFLIFLFRSDIWIIKQYRKFAPPGGQLLDNAAGTRSAAGQKQ